VITDCVFTDTAILRKGKAAYRTTSIAALAEDDEMNEQLKKTLEGLSAGLEGLTKQFAALSASVEDLKKGPEKVEANAHTMSMVEPHARRARRAPLEWELPALVAIRSVDTQSYCAGWRAICALRRRLAACRTSIAITTIS
jgi:hypothetical protein